MALPDDGVDELVEGRVGGKGRDIDARHHHLMDPALAELQDGADHLFLFRLDDALLAAPLDQDPDLVAGQPVLVYLAHAQDASGGVGDGGQQRDQGPQYPAQQDDRPADEQRVSLRVGQRQPLGHELAEDDGHQADESRDQEQGDDTGLVLQRRDAGDDRLEGDGQVRAGVGRRQEADEGDADLDDRQEATGIGDEARHASSTPVALLHHLLKPAAPDRDQGDLRCHEERVDEDERADDEQLAHELAAHGSFWRASGGSAGARRSRSRAGIPTASLPDGTSRVTTEPAPVTAPSPISTGARRMVSEPMKASSPMRVACLRCPS